jgi:hypothetical protein
MPRTGCLIKCTVLEPLNRSAQNFFRRIGMTISAENLDGIEQRKVHWVWRRDALQFIQNVSQLLDAAESGQRALQVTVAGPTHPLRTCPTVRRKSIPKTTHYIQDGVHLRIPSAVAEHGRQIQQRIGVLGVQFDRPPEVRLRPTLSTEVAFQAFVEFSIRFPRRWSACNLDRRRAQFIIPHC